MNDLNTFYQQQPPMTPMQPMQPQQLQFTVLNAIEPIVQYGLQESYIQHAMREIAAISYLMGMGYQPMVARQIVESWEAYDESFYYGR